MTSHQVLFLMLAFIVVILLGALEFVLSKHLRLRRNLDQLVKRDGFAVRKHDAVVVDYKEC